MDLYSFLATIILITSLVTLLIAIAAYIAYKIREVRKPSKARGAEAGSTEPIFLRSHVTGAMLRDLKAALSGENPGHPGAAGLASERKSLRDRNAQARRDSPDHYA